MKETKKILYRNNKYLQLHCTSFEIRNLDQDYRNENASLHVNLKLLSEEVNFD